MADLEELENAQGTDANSAPAAESSPQEETVAAVEAAVEAPVEEPVEAPAEPAEEVVPVSIVDEVLARIADEEAPAPPTEPETEEISASTGGSRAILVRLRPTGPWRIGPDSGDRDRVDRVYHSDSLFSAVCGAMLRMGWLDEWLAATATALGAPAVRFSSCFPFHANTLYVIPPRHLWPPAAGSSKVRWKGATFVPTSVVEALLAGETPREDGWLIDNECLVPVGAGGGLFRASVRSGAAVDRDGVGVAAHSAACLEFTPQSGLWFVISFASDGAREQWSERVKAAVRLLADSGFGGKRSQGWGHAEAPEFVEGSLPNLVLKKRAQDGEMAHWLLSSYHPADGDGVDWNRGNYAIATRRGRVESSAGWGEMKKPARMITEGSVVVSAAAPQGSAANVAPENFAHPVYRAGFAVSIPVPLAPKGKAS
ncbi:MAG: type III-A CRISPR-associated RAMP protein Csm4 [Bryobacteraceae bacterium]